jgi:hypothetical protein
MNYKSFLIAGVSILALFSQDVFAQSKKNPTIAPSATEKAKKMELLSGPFVSYVDGYSTRVWLMVPKGSKEVKLRFEDFDQFRSFEVTQKVGKKGDYQRNRWKRINSEYLLGDQIPVIIDVQNLSKDKEYNVEVYIDNQLVKEEFAFYMERAHPTDVYFLFGGNFMDVKNTSIFGKMQRTPNDFMIWGGNNFGKSPVGYDFSSYTEYCKKVRTNKVLDEFMQSTPQIATWGKYDFDAEAYGKTYINKDSALYAFDLMWPNLPKKVYNYTFNNYGTYGKYDYEDVDVFLLDDQTFRDNEKHQTKFGGKQVERLLRDLTASDATFKVVVSNSSFFGDEDEASKNYSDEFNMLMKRIHKGNTDGLFFLSLNENGKTDMLHYQRENDYDLTELSLGSLSGDNGTYARVRVEGGRDNRKLFVDIYDKNGHLINTASFLASELK